MIWLIIIVCQILKSIHVIDEPINPKNILYYQYHQAEIVKTVSQINYEAIVAISNLVEGIYSIPDEWFLRHSSNTYWKIRKSLNTSLGSTYQKHWWIYNLDRERSYVYWISFDSRYSEFIFSLIKLWYSYKKNKLRGHNKNGKFVKTTRSTTTSNIWDSARQTIRQLQLFGTF